MSDDPSPRQAPARTLFLGSGGFAVPILEALAGAPRIDLVGVVSAPDRPSGRRAELTPVPVTRRARELRLPLLQPDRIRSPEAVAEIAALRPDLGVLADYGQIVPAAVLSIPPHGILNVHPSALPRHRGASPIAATIEAGDPIAAVFLIRMDEGLDTGPIVAGTSWSLAGDETAPALEAEAARRGAALLIATIDDWLAGRRPAVPQSTTGVSLSRPLRREDGRLDPTRGATALERQVRAYQPWPGSFVETAEGRLIVHAAEVAPGLPSDAPGRIEADGSGLALTTTDGRLRLTDVQLAGRRRTDAASLRRGAPALAGQPVVLR
ncbi:MAG: methionyl-tRNA formyltransferase [Chloroflexi bacterium]|nr:methionyl-tRNA formyltransferase [Chloroflexota bacterium]